MQCANLAIKRYSEISRSHTLLIDNYNEFTGTVNVVERIDFLPIYRVFKRSSVRSPEKIFHEIYFQKAEYAFRYWSDLMKEKQELF